MTTLTEHIQSAIDLLKKLIATPSLSGKEDQTAALIEHHLLAHHIEPHRILNNVWAVNQQYDPAKKTILLNSHHDTVKPNNGYTKDPYSPITENGVLYGLGSNDAGGPLVCLIEAFINFYAQSDLQYNLALACTAEEEISGKNGILATIPTLPAIDAAIIGEPTLLDMAIAEKGLMVLECVTRGKSGHAARDEGDNAIYKALEDIEWFKNFRFEKESSLLGPVKMTTTIIEAGSQHNVVPDSCRFIVDVRTTDCYSNEETLDIIKANISAEISPRSLRLNPSKIDLSHPLVQAGLSLGLQTYGSPTLSDQSLIDVPSLKIGPGDSARSHTPDEYIFIEEISSGIATYKAILDHILVSKTENSKQENKSL